MPHALRLPILPPQLMLPNLRTFRPLRFRRLAILALATVACGCSQQASVPPSAADTELMDALLSDLPDDEPTGSSYGTPALGNHTSVVSHSRTASASETSRIPGFESRTSQATQSVAPTAAAARGERLELQLRPGDRFPLIKTVEQHLVQRSEQYPATAHTRLELTLAITVEQVRQDAVLMNVRYSRVSYSHDINGSRLEYDSAVHQSGYPRDAEPYAGMVNNGFAFWLGRDNQIRELVGYQDFLQRCVQNVPVERRQTMLSEISNRFGDDGVANFVDDSIGLLPYDTSVDPSSATRVTVGDVWTRETRLMQPAPVYLNSTYRLVTLNPQTAEIEISGRIASGESVPTPDSSMLKISGGHSMGKCTVDRATGLPLDVTVTRFVNMIITLPDGQTVPQDKQIFTRIRAFPEVRGPEVRVPVAQQQGGTGIQPAAAAGSAGGVQQAAAWNLSPQQNPAGNPAPGNPIPGNPAQGNSVPGNPQSGLAAQPQTPPMASAPLSARAVYPD